MYKVRGNDPAQASVLNRSDRARTLHGANLRVNSNITIKDS